MTLIEAIEQRHSVRSFTDKVIDNEIRAELQKEVDACNAESGLHLSLVFDDSQGFDSWLARYGAFKNVNNYIVIAGKKNDDIDEKCGYYGEKVVLKAAQLGLNTCWVGLSYNKSFCKKHLQKDEKLSCVIALGYGVTQGQSHKSKSMDTLFESDEPLIPAWKEGLRLAQLAPTATNQQKFKFYFKQGSVTVKKGIGFYAAVDLGIVKYHFEVGSGVRL